MKQYWKYALAPSEALLHCMASLPSECLRAGPAAWLHGPTLERCPWVLPLLHCFFSSVLASWLKQFNSGSPARGPRGYDPPGCRNSRSSRLKVPRPNSTSLHCVTPFCVAVGGAGHLASWPHLTPTDSPSGLVPACSSEALNPSIKHY